MAAIGLGSVNTIVVPAKQSGSTNAVPPLLDDFLDDCQPHAAPLHVSSGQPAAGKKIALRLGRNARAVVVYRQPDVSCRQRPACRGGVKNAEFWSPAVAAVLGACARGYRRSARPGWR